MLTGKPLNPSRSSCGSAARRARSSVRARRPACRPARSGTRRAARPRSCRSRRRRTRADPSRAGAPCRRAPPRSRRADRASRRTGTSPRARGTSRRPAERVALDRRAARRSGAARRAPGRGARPSCMISTSRRRACRAAARRDLGADVALDLAQSIDRQVERAAVVLELQRRARPRVLIRLSPRCRPARRWCTRKSPVASWPNPLTPPAARRPAPGLLVRGACAPSTSAAVITASRSARAAKPCVGKVARKIVVPALNSPASASGPPRPSSTPSRRSTRLCMASRRRSATATPSRAKRWIAATSGATCSCRRTCARGRALTACGDHRPSPTRTCSSSKARGPRGSAARSGAPR